MILRYLQIVVSALLFQNNFISCVHADNDELGAVLKDVASPTLDLRVHTDSDSARAARIRDILVGLRYGSELKVETQAQTFTGERVCFDGEFILLKTDVLEETTLPSYNVETLYVRIPVDRRKSGFKWGALIGGVVGAVTLVAVSVGASYDVPYNPSGAVLMGLVTGGTLGGGTGAFIGSRAQQWDIAYPVPPP